MRLHVSDERFEIVGGQRLVRHQQHRIDRNQSDRRKVTAQIVADIVDDAADMGVPLADVDRVAIWSGSRQTSNPDGAAGAADVFDDHRLAERRAHLVGHDARGHIGRAARRKRHDQRDRPRREIIGVRGSERERQERERDRGDCKNSRENSRQGWRNTSRNYSILHFRPPRTYVRQHLCPILSHVFSHFITSPPPGGGRSRAKRAGGGEYDRAAVVGFVVAHPTPRTFRCATLPLQGRVKRYHSRGADARELNKNGHMKP